ncbi:MAG: hypothetical protein ACREHD_06950 [Pirellulales bacterium]
MASASPPGYLLDTNILVHLIRGKAVGKAIEANFGLHGGLNRSIICVVTVGETYSLARKWNWGQSRVARLQWPLPGSLVPSVLPVTNSPPSRP